MLVEDEPINQEVSLCLLEDGIQAIEMARQACLAAGMNDHIPKPIDPDNFYESLIRWLEVSRRQASRQVAAPASRCMKLTPSRSRHG